MAGYGALLTDDFLDELPGPEVTVFNQSVVSGQHEPGMTAGRGSMAPVHMRDPINDFTPTEPYVHEGGGVASRFSLNPMLSQFPSAGMDDDNGMRAGQMHMRNLLKAQKAYATGLAAKDPQAAGMAFADMDGMRDGFRALTAAGWNGREAAHTIGAVGRVFGGYGNAAENAMQLKRYADTRGVDMQTAGNELWSLQKNFGAGYLTSLGFTGKVTEDSAVHDNIRDNFTDLLSAMWKVEDQYNWQFDQATYQDVFTRCRGIAADLDQSGLSVKSVGAEAIVRAALKENGSLNDDAMLSEPVTQLMQSRTLDRGLITLSPGFTEDTASNPFSIQAPAKSVKERLLQDADNQDFGMVRQLRQALFRHRAHSVNMGLGANDFSDMSTLRRDFANTFRMFSTGSARVDDDTFLKLADAVIGGVAAGRPTSVTEAAQALVGEGLVSEDQADALATWARSTVMDTAEGDRTLRETVQPFIEKLAMEAGVSMKDPAIAPFAARAYSIAKRALRDRTTVAGLEGLEQEATQQVLWDSVKARLAPMIEQLTKATKFKNEQLAAAVEAKAMAAQRAKEEG